jgi:branched-chain amino acid transport system permease protein
VVNVLLSGLVNGAFYIAITIGVVIGYRFGHTVNFASGAVATFGAYCAYEMLSQGVDYWAAIAIAIVASAVANLVIGLVLMTLLARASDLMASLATLGIALALVGVVGMVWGQDVKSLPTPELLSGAIQFGEYSVSAIGLVVLCIVVAITLALALFLRTTRQGVLLRATADSRAVSVMNAVPVVGLTLVVWLISGALAGLAGVVITPQLSLTPFGLTSLLIIGLAAAVLGGLSSLGGLIVGGLIFGVVVAFGSYFFQTEVLATAALIVLVVIMLLKPKGLFGGRESDSVGILPEFIESSAGARRTQRRTVSAVGSTIGARFAMMRQGLLDGRVTGALLERSSRGGLLRLALFVVVAIATIVIVPNTVSVPVLFMLSSAAIMIIAISGQGVLSGLSGMVSLAQGGFMLVASYVSGIFAASVGAPQLLAILFGVVAGAIVASLMGLFVARITGLYLTILTSILALAIPEIATGWRSLTGGPDGLYTAGWFFFGKEITSSADLFVIYAVLALVVLVLVTFLKRSHAGLRTRGVRDSEIGAQSIGINVARTRIVAFCIAGAIAGLAGATATFQLGAVAPSSFTLWTSIYIVFACAVGGVESTLIGPVIGGLLIIGLPYIFSGSGVFSQIIFGVGLLVLISIQTALASRQPAESGPRSTPTLEEAEAQAVGKA